MAVSIQQPQQIATNTRRAQSWSYWFEQHRSEEKCTHQKASLSQNKTFRKASWVVQWRQCKPRIPDPLRQRSLTQLNSSLRRQWGYWTTLGQGISCTRSSTFEVYSKRVRCLRLHNMHTTGQLLFCITDSHRRNTKGRVKERNQWGGMWHCCLKECMKWCCASQRVDYQYCQHIILSSFDK